MRYTETINKNELCDINTGCVRIFENKHEEDHYYAFLLKYGHSGSGYFVPILTVVNAKSPEFAINIAKDLGKVKKTQKYNVLAMKEVDKATAILIGYINDFDPFLFLDDTDKVQDLYERRVIMEEAAINKPGVKDTRRDGGRKFWDIRTADEYGKKYVLQRYTAPVLEGDKYVFPKRFKLNQIMDEYFYYKTRYLGIIRGKLTPLSLYYQIYGENNELGIKYQNGVLSYNDIYGNPKNVEIPQEIARHLNNIKDNLQQQDKSENFEVCEDIKITGAREKFESRYKKYQDCQQSENEK